MFLYTEILDENVLSFIPSADIFCEGVFCGRLLSFEGVRTRIGTYDTMKTPLDINCVNSLRTLLSIPHKTLLIMNDISN
ncbi:ORF1089 [White spot syndrome virus]|uniref:ORF1089 n=1 Tax=White spot syndrome virus TaxID=342409 RepID=A0A2D3I657_9VIRU|nr:ORF1089 [White spot syndrome virus]